MDGAEQNAQDSLERARDREAALRDVLDIISQSRDDELPVFNTILENALRLCDADMAVVNAANDAMTEVGYAAGINSAGPEFQPGRDSWSIDSEMFVCRAIKENRTFHTTDLKDTELYRSGDPTRCNVVDSEGMRTQLVLPLKQGDKAIASFSLYRRKVQPFSDSEIALLETFAAQAVIAIENVRQFRELQTRLEREAASREVLGVISQSRDDDLPVFDSLLENAARLCKAENAGLVLVADDQTHFSIAATLLPQAGFIPGENLYPLEMDLGAANCMREARIIHRRDVREVLEDKTKSEMSASATRLLVDEGVRTTLWVPLLRGDDVIGSFGLYRHEVREFAQDEIALVETFAAQAVIAIENVRQFRALQTRLEREAATREILQVISRSRDDAKPVFEILLQTAQRLCNSSHGAIVLGEAGGGPQVLGAHTSGLDEIEKRYESGDFPMDPQTSLAAKAIVDRKTLHFADLKESEPYRNMLPIAVRMVNDEGICSSLYVPLISNGASIGCLNLHRREQQAYSADEIALVETFAAQAVIAIENVRQFRELQNRLEREAATGEVLSVINRSQVDEAPVFETILENALRLCKAEFGAVVDYDPTDTHIRLVTERGMNAQLRAMYRDDPPPMDAEHSIFARTMLRKETFHIDIADPSHFPSGSRHVGIAATAGGVRMCVLTPLLIDDECVGLIGLFRFEAQEFEPEQIALLKTFAAQAAIAMQNVRQFRELQTRLEREAASRDVLQVISQSRDDEGPVFDVILENAARLCRSPHAGLHLVDEARENWVLASIWADQEREDAIGGSFRLDAPLPASRAIMERRCVQVADLSDHDLYRQRDPMWVHLVEQRGMRTLMAVPLMQGDEAIGSISMYRREVEPFREDEIELVKTFTAQAVIAIENVRQFRELQTRLEREKATGEVLSIISQSRDDEQPVFDAILESSARLCDSPTASLFLLNEERDALVYRSWWGESFTAFEVGVSTFPMSLDIKPVQAVRDGRTYHVADIAEADTYLNSDPMAVKSVEEEGIRTLLSVPLMLGSDAIGCINLVRREVKPFDDRQIELVKTFAAQAVIAIENVRQFRELQTRLEREKASAEILEVIGRSRDDEGPVFDVILKNAMRLCDVDHAALCIANDARTEVVLAAFAGWMVKEFQVGVDSWPIDGQQNLARAVAEKRMIHTPDMRDTDLYRAGDETRVAVVDEEGLRTQLALPLMQRGEAIGSLLFFRRKVLPFDDADIALLETFAAQAVIAIENVRQFRALEARTEEVQTLNAGLEARVEAQVGEIERMGKLKSFLPSAVADAVVSSGSEDMLKSHRALLGILFCDIRGFTAFCETAEPEETMAVLQTYHQVMGRLIADHGAGVDHRMGDGIMVLFNDPLPCDDPAGDAVRLAMAMREKMTELCKGWKKLGHRLGFGVGVSLGYATVGMVGYEGRSDYTASGTAVNLAARLCDKAEDGEILLSPRAAIAVEDDFVCEAGGELELKGLTAPVEVTRVAAER